MEFGQTSYTWWFFIELILNGCSQQILDCLQCSCHLSALLLSPVYLCLLWWSGSLMHQMEIVFKGFSYLSQKMMLSAHRKILFTFLWKSTLVFLRILQRLFTFTLMTVVRRTRTVSHVKKLCGHTTSDIGMVV